MNKEEIINRVSQIHSEMETCKATFSKLQGHLEEANHWMQELHKAELAAATEQVESPMDEEEKE